MRLDYKEVTTDDVLNEIKSEHDKGFLVKMHRSMPSSRPVIWLHVTSQEGALYLPMILTEISIDDYQVIRDACDSFTDEIPQIPMSFDDDPISKNEPVKAVVPVKLKPLVVIDEISASYMVDTTKPENKESGVVVPVINPIKFEPRVEAIAHETHQKSKFKLGGRK